MASAWAVRRSVIRGRVVRRAVGGVCIVLCATACGHPAAPSSAPQPSSRLLALLGNYYGPREAAGPTPGAVALGGCRADEGDTCFGGDHEDQLCRRVPGCRSDAARSRFLEALGAGARAEPRSAGWVGHAVYAHTRMDRPVTALDLASECSAERTWCGLLMGLALHRNGRALDAESAFRSALDESPLECLLRDVGPLLDDTARELYASWSCDERSEFDRRFWWMTDPSLAEAGNPRWVEHVARGVELILHRQILDAVRSHHPAHHDDQVVRRGAEDSFDDEGRFAGLRSACCHFVPESGGPEEPLDLLRYRLASDRGREGFTPAAGPVLDTEVQWARFEADGRVEIVGISESERALRLTWSPAPEQVDRLGLVHPEPSGRVEAIARVAPTEGLLDLESEGTAPRVRARLGVNAWPQGHLRVSDLLLLRAGQSEAAGSRDEAVDRALPTTTIRGHRAVGLYWEVYGVPDGQPITLTLRLEGPPPGFWGRLGAVIGRSPRNPAEVQWAARSGGDPHREALDVDLGNLGEGSHTLVLTVRNAAGDRFERRREIEVAR